MTENKTLVSNISKKWKLEQIPSKKLEMENKLMEERLQILKNELLHDKNKRSSQGGTIWSKGQPGPVTNYAKTVLKTDKNSNDESVLNKLTNRQMKLKVLKDEIITKIEKTNPTKEKKFKCGQCEKGLAFTRCLECGEDYCANCFTSFHMKGALQKHRTIPISNESNYNKQYSHPQFYQNETSILSSRSTTYSETNEIISKNMKAVSFINNQNNESLNEPNSLLAGEYDENEAQESFKQAVMEWRNSSNKNSSNNNTLKTSAKSNKSIHKDVILGTEDLTPRKLEDTKKNLENYISSNHSLSYAERILLQKYRSNELEYLRENSNCDEKTKKEINLRNTAKLANSQHINFDNLMDSLTNDSQNQSGSSNAIFNENNFEHVLTNREKSFCIEELQDFSAKKSINYSQNEPIKKVNGIIKEKNLINSQKSFEKPNELKKDITNNETNNSVKSTDFLSPANRIGSGLTREPSKILKEISSRQADLTYKMALDGKGIDNFFILDVASSKKSNTSMSVDLDVNKKPNYERENTKISHNLYNQSPRSWNPNKSLVNNVTTESIALKKEASNISTKESRTNKNESEKENMQKNKNEISPTNKNLAKINGNIRTNSSLEFKKKTDITKPTKTNPRDDLKQRNKSFVGTLTKVSSVKNTRAVSASCSYPLKSNRQNVDFSHQFIEFDIDDGRSSKLCQNEDDDNYFGELEIEFKSSVHRVTNISRESSESSKKNTASLNNDLVESTEKLTKNLKNFNLEQSLKNDEDYEDVNNDLEMTMGELKML